MWHRQKYTQREGEEEEEEEGEEQEDGTSARGDAREKNESPGRLTAAQRAQEDDIKKRLWSELEPDLIDDVVSHLVPI